MSRRCQGSAVLRATWARLFAQVGQRKRKRRQRRRKRKRAGPAGLQAASAAFINMKKTSPDRQLISTARLEWASSPLAACVRANCKQTSQTGRAAGRERRWIKASRRARLCFVSIGWLQLARTQLGSPTRHLRRRRRRRRHETRAPSGTRDIRDASAASSFAMPQPRSRAMSRHCGRSGRPSRWLGSAKR